MGEGLLAPSFIIGHKSGLFDNLMVLPDREISKRQHTPSRNIGGTIEKRHTMIDIDRRGLAGSEPEIAVGGAGVPVTGAGGAAQARLDAVSSGRLGAIESGIGATQNLLQIGGGFSGSHSQA
jgi:hypothetical protein